MQRVRRWTATAIAGVAAAGVVFGLGVLFRSWNQGWVQAAAGLAAAIIMAPMGVWAADGKPDPVRRISLRKLPTARDVPIPPNPEFVGREGLLVDISTRFSDSRSVVVQALHGMGGVGKTQLVAHYAHTHWTKYRIIWWIQAEDAPLIGAQLAQLGYALGITSPGEDSSSAQRRLMAHLDSTSDWLIIYDNVKSPEELQSLLPSGKGHILITSRSGGWSHIGSGIEIREMERPESVALIRKRDPDISPHDADRLAAGLGDLPLALVQATGFMQSSGADVRGYLGMVNEYASKIMMYGPAGAHDKPLTASVRLSVEQLASIASDAVPLLQTCAQLAPEPIPYGWLTSGALQQPEASRESELSIRHSLTLFASLGLTTVVRDGIQLHRLTRAIILDFIDPNEEPAIRIRAQSLLLRQRPGSTDDPTSWPRWAQLIPHLLAINPTQADNPQISRMTCDAARYLFKSGQITAGYQLAISLHSEWSNRLGADHPDTLGAAQQLAHAFRLLGRYREAEKISRDVFNHRRQSLGDNHPDTLWSASNLAVALRQLGDYHHAREIDEDTLVRRQNVLGEDHADTLTSASNLAVDLRQLGDYHHAREIDESTLVRRQNVLGHVHPDTLDSANNLAIDLARMGQYERALILNEETFARRREVLGHDHPDTLWTASNLAVCLRGLGDHERARLLNENTLARRREILGHDHPDALRSASHLAVDLRNLGDYKRALELNEDTFARRKAILGEGHSDTIRSEKNLAITKAGYTRRRKIRRRPILSRLLHLYPVI